MYKKDMLEKAMLFFFGVYDKISNAVHVEGDLAERNKAESIIAKLIDRGVQFNNTELAMWILIPHNSLGIRMWGYVDYLSHIKPVYVRIEDSATPAFSPNPKTRRVDSVKAKLEQKKVLAAKKPYKYSLAR